MTQGPDLDAATLLRHLAAELTRLADTADAVQHDTADLAHRLSGETAAFVVRLQALDAMSQVLRDLQRLAAAAAALPSGHCPADAAFLRRTLLLQSLAERLIVGPRHDDGHDPATFLL